MDASRAAEIIMSWKLSLVSGGVPETVDSGFRVALAVAAHIRLVWSATVSLMQKNYGAHRWNLMSILSSTGCGGTKKAIRRRSSGRI